MKRAFVGILLLICCCCVGCMARTTEMTTKDSVYNAEYMPLDGVRCAFYINELILSQRGREQTMAAINADQLSVREEYIEAQLAAASALGGAGQNVSIDCELNFWLADADNKYISIVADAYCETQGAAHADAARYGYVYDAASGERLMLDALLDEQQRQNIAADIVEQIEDDGSIMLFYPQLQHLLLLYMQDGQWYVANARLHLIYQPYQIASYSMGVMEFEAAL